MPKGPSTTRSGAPLPLLVPLLSPGDPYGAARASRPRPCPKRDRLYRWHTLAQRQPAAAPSYTVSPAGQRLKRRRTPSAALCGLVSIQIRGPARDVRGHLNAGPSYLTASRGVQDEGIIRESASSRLVNTVGAAQAVGRHKKAPPRGRG